MNSSRVNASTKGPQANARAPNAQGSSNANANANANAGKGASEGNSKIPMIIIIVITILLFVFVILWITFAMKSNSLKGKAITKQPVQLQKTDTPTQVGSSEFPASQVGREYTYSFWLYLENFNRQTTPGMIMYRGNPGSLQSANPIVMMDKESNKLYVIIKTVGSSVATEANGNPELIMDRNYFMSARMNQSSPGVNYHLVCPIDFVPLQRWVHVACVVDNKLVTLYLDGQIYSVKSTDEFKAARQPEVSRLGKVLDYNVIIDKTEGDLVIGKSTISNRSTVDGFLGKVEFFNYAVTMEDVKKIYQTGPMPSGFLSWLGLSQYGFRSPIYNLSEAGNN